MKTGLILSSLFVGAASFTVAPRSSRHGCTSLSAAIPTEEMTENQLKIKEIQDKWGEIRLLSREEAEAQLEGEWLEAYNRFFTKYDEDMTRFNEIADVVQKAIEPPKVEKKTKGQRKRDAYAKVLARQAAREAAK